MNIKDLQTLDEVLHYGGIGEVVATSPEDWEVLEVLIEKYLDENTPECDLEAGYDSGVEDGYSEGYNRCLNKYGLEE